MDRNQPIAILLSLTGPDALPTHAACVLDGDKWQFKALTDNSNSAKISLDSVYASASFSRVNAVSLAIGDEFNYAIPGAYRYKTTSGIVSKSYMKLMRRPGGTFGKAYVTHRILDSITQCGRVMFINMDSKQFDFNAVFLPIKIHALRRSDSRDAPDLDLEIQKGIWMYFRGRTWGHCRALGRMLLFTIEAFEIVPAPDAERVTMVWQSKSFLPSLASLPAQLSSGLVAKPLARDAAAAGRKVIRAVDLAKTSGIGINIDGTVRELVEESGVVVEYFYVASTTEDADLKM
ncbi:hypothetical protein BU15DRAFT_81281 [Melanogaster broomeanus]|nr:hypothetical protein BU15DRAFT_81281 [Melanogaster broomeanus]